MTEAKSKGRPGRAWRFRSYFALVDLATLLVAITIVQVAIDPAALTRDDEPQGWEVAVGLIGLAVPIFLMFARSWRDEFAELCWRRAAANTLQMLVLVPLVLLFTLGIKSGWDDAHQRALGANPPPPVSLLEAYSAGDAFAWCWTLLITLFVLAFQFHRWRGSR